MKKSIFFFLFSMAITGLCAQTTLPTSFSNFGSTLPTGWTYLNNNGLGSTYAVGSDATPACRLDNTGEYLEIFFSDVPGTLTYYAKGTGMSAPYFTGRFSILESVDGSAWDTVRNFTTAIPLTGSFVLYTENITSTSRYVRFYYTQKLSGTNVALDQVTLNKAVLPVDINIMQGTTDIINGSVFSIGTSAATAFKVQNLGATSALTIASSPISGTDASMFNITGMPATVAAGGESTFTLNFAPTGPDGSKFCTITINSDDPNDPAYVVNIYGIMGTVATEPTAQPTGISFSNVRSYTFNVAFSAASPAPDNYLVLIKRGSDFIAEQPVDNTTYHKGDYIGGAQVAYVGTATSLTPNFIVANTNYYLRIYSFNGPAGFENYLQTSPLSGSTLTSDGNIGTTYSGVSTLSPSFITQLHNVTFPHTQIYYANYAPVMIDNFESRDTTDGQKVVTCAYTGYNYVYTGAFAWTPIGQMAREHSYCYSWMPASIGQDSVPYSDLRNLFPVEFTHSNAVRSNYPLGDVVNVTSTWNGGTFGTNSSGQTVYEPRDSDKGDAARAIMYMSICYTGIAGNLWAIPANQSQDVLKAWHFQDPPDNWEIARNDFIDWKQGNRNPFVDSADYVCHIDFSNMTYIANPGTCIPSGINTNSASKGIFSMYPNPASDVLNIFYTLENNEDAFLRISDFTGKTVYEKSVTVNSGNGQISVPVTDFHQGIYMISITSPDINFNQKIVVVH